MLRVQTRALFRLARQPLIGMAAGLLVIGTGEPVAAEEATRIGQGDSRAGYEKTDYRTDSRRLAEPGEALDLAALYADPPLGLPPTEGTLDPAQIALGKRLFFDRRLSFNGTLSCAMCHIPEQGFTQYELATPVGIEGRIVKRNAPTLYNVAFRTNLFHDGRENSLIQQVWSPLLAANEMGNPSIGVVLQRLSSLDDYADSFSAVFGAPPDMLNLGIALAAYQSALLAAESRFDRWYFGGDSGAVSVDVKRGFRLFVEHGCSTCHTLDTGHALFADGRFHDTGVGYRYSVVVKRQPREMQIAPGEFVELATEVLPPAPSDLGRYEATGVSADRWKYATPSLRNVAITQPYMHNGAFPTLASVIDFYAAGGEPHEGQDPRIRPLPLSAADKSDLVEFLRALTSSNVDALAGDARRTAIGDY